MQTRNCRRKLHLPLKASAVRGLDEESTAQTMMDGIRIYYNFIRPHKGLNGRTPAQKANLMMSGEKKWKSLIQQSTRMKSE